MLMTTTDRASESVVGMLAAVVLICCCILAGLSGQLHRHPRVEQNPWSDNRRRTVGDAPPLCLRMAPFVDVDARELLRSRQKKRRLKP